FGSALLIKQGLFPPAPSGGHSSQTLGGSPDVKPLAQGPRVVYAHDGSLWSAPENGPGVAERLTPTGIRVGVWTIAPDGAHVAYVDAATGRIHVIRSDDQDDVATDSSSITTDGAALVWSPDGIRIAYLAGQPGGPMALHLMNADGTNDLAIAAASAVSSAPIWSPDGLWLAYTQDADGAQSLWLY